MSVHHSFDIELAKELRSVDMAVLVHHFAYWIDYNQRLKRNKHEGKYWTYQTLEEIAAHFPYWSRDQVKRLIVNLVNKNILVKGNFNKTSFDRTVWYSFSDEFAKSIWRNRQMDIPETPDGYGQTATPIPHTKTDTKTDKKKEYSSDSQSSPEHPADFSFSSSSGSFEGITDDDVAAWRTAYPDIDINQEIVRAEQWLLSNPSKANKKLWRKFLVGWFTRANEKAENRKAYRSNTSSLKDSKFRSWEKHAKPERWKPKQATLEDV